jgi:ABC-2 type transport system ATP-binding protein
MAIIQVNNLKKYYGEHMGIENVSFSVEQGEIYGFIGPNGAGKSTTIRILMGLLFPNSGSAQIFSKDVFQFDEEIKSRVGYVPAESVFYKNMKVKDILAYSAKLRGCDAKRIKDLTELFELDISKRGKELSFGNAKKVSIILALMHSPDLLIMDEPTSGLDPVMQQRFFNLIEQERERGATVLLSTHILNDVQRVCDRAAVIKRGVIADVINIKELAQQQVNIEQKFIQYYI